MAKKIIQQIQAEIFDYSELNTNEKALVDEAKGMLDQAYAPLFQFSCRGCSVIGKRSDCKGQQSGKCGIPFRLMRRTCRPFLAQDRIIQREEIKKIAIVAKPLGANDFVMASSCGNCRQAMMEYESKQKKPIQLLFVQPNDKILKTTVGDLLPFGFDSKSLNG